MEKKSSYQERKTNLDDEIYLLTYATPYYKDELSMIIYGKKGHPTVINKLKNMANRNPPWVYIVKYEDIPKRYGILKLLISDKSKALRHYVIANPEILFLKLINRLKRNNCELTNKEKKELKNCLKSGQFLFWVQQIIENSLYYDDYPYDGDIQDVFYSMVNFILAGSVFQNSLYEYMLKIQQEIGLNISGLDSKKNFKKKMDDIEVTRKSHWIPFSSSLVKKLYKLDVHTANNLQMFFTLFGDIITEFHYIFRLNKSKLKDIVTENKKKQQA